jgi:hypothetical protein
MPQQGDDPVAVPNETRLFRRVPPTWITYDKNRGEWRPTSQSFQNSDDDKTMSAFAENLALANGESPSDFLRERWSEFLLVAVTAGWMRKCGQDVYPDPYNQDPGESFASHVAVRGTKDSKIRPKLGREYEWVIAPPNRYEPPK